MAKLSDAQIKRFLEDAPLYTWKEFERPDVNRGSLHINEIDDYCDTCKQRRPFQDLRSRGSGAAMPTKALGSGTSYFEFTCVSCKKDNRRFLLEQIVDEEKIRLQKYGELPRKKLPRSPALQKFFSNDQDYYEKAIVCLASGYGIGAFAYFRRIIERNIENLVALLEEDTQATGGADEIAAALKELHQNSPMSDKIKIANRALPSYLIPNGLNPLGRIYQILSEGIHSLADEDCLNRATEVRNCLEFLISELASRKRNRDSFASKIGSLHPK